MAAARKPSDATEPPAKQCRVNDSDRVDDNWRFTDCKQPLCTSRTYNRLPRTDFKWSPDSGPPVKAMCQVLDDTSVLLYRKAYAEVPEHKYRLPGDSVDKGGVYHRFRRRPPVVARALLFLWFSHQPSSAHPRF
jgi:hypothetical protein